MRFRVEVRHLLHDPWLEIGQVEADNEEAALSKAEDERLGTEQEAGLVEMRTFAGEPVARAVVLA